MSDAHRLPPKKEVLLALLEKSSVMIHIDPRRNGIIVPKWFQKQPQLTLQIGLNLPVPILDLEVEDDAVCCTLSFNRSPFWCKIPWHAIFALVGEDGRGMVWPDDVPIELVRETRLDQKDEVTQPAQKPKLRSLKTKMSKGTEDKRPKTKSKKVTMRIVEEPSSVSNSEEKQVNETSSIEEPKEEKKPPRSNKPVQNKIKRPIPSYLRVIK